MTIEKNLPEGFIDIDVLSPANNAVIWFMSDLEDEPVIGKVCKRGCCVNCNGLYKVSLYLAVRYYKPATVEEIAREEERISFLKPISYDEIWDLLL